MKVYGFTEKTHGIMETGSGVEAFREFVGGKPGAYCIGSGLYVVLNGEGRLEGLSLRVEHHGEYGAGQAIAGDCFVCRCGADGNFEPVVEEDRAYIEERLIPVMTYGG